MNLLLFMLTFFIYSHCSDVMSYLSTVSSGLPLNPPTAYTYLKSGKDTTHDSVHFGDIIDSILVQTFL